LNRQQTAAEPQQEREKVQVERRERIEARREREIASGDLLRELERRSALRIRLWAEQRVLAELQQHGQLEEEHARERERQPAQATALPRGPVAPWQSSTHRAAII
jgi:hypothetical protein